MSTLHKRTGSNPVHVEADSRTLLGLRRMARELRLTDQILSFDIDSVSVIEKGPAPAWTSPDGSAITINRTRMPPLTKRKNVAVWLGTNAHELFHNLFSPRENSPLILRVIAAAKSTNPSMFRSWNMLEDARIERLGLNRYEAWRGYLIAALAHHIPVTHPSSWLLVAGRTWLSRESRRLSRALFVAEYGESAACDASRLIGAYQSLRDPGHDDADEAYDIVAEFDSLFGSTTTRGGCGGPPIRQGEPEDADPDEGGFPCADDPINWGGGGDDESGEGEGEGDDTEGEGEGSGSGSDDEGEGDEGDGDAEGSGDEGEGDEGEGSGDGSGGESDDPLVDTNGDDDADGDGNGGEGDARNDEAGGGCSAPGDSDGKQGIRGSFDNDIDEALKDAETAADLDRVVDQIAHGSSGELSDAPRSVGEWLDVPDSARAVGREVADVLSEIRDDCEAAWVRRTDTGRFNVGRWATDPDWDADNVFDQFDPGAMDASGLDVVLAVDVSGSMMGQMGELAEATWAIRQAVDRVEGTCTVLGFGTELTVVAAAGERPDGRIFIPSLEDSTNPTPALREAHRIIAQSEAANRLVIVLTDGYWWSAGTAEDAMRAAKQDGATTCVVGLGPTAARFVKPGFCDADVTACITRSSELVPIFRELAERSMKAAAGIG